MEPSHRDVDGTSDSCGKRGRHRDVFAPGLIKVGAVINGKTGFCLRHVNPRLQRASKSTPPRSAISIGAGSRSVRGQSSPQVIPVRRALRVALASAGGRHRRRSGVRHSRRAGHRDDSRRQRPVSATTNVRVVAGACSGYQQPATTSSPRATWCFNASILPASAAGRRYGGPSAATAEQRPMASSSPSGQTYVITAAAGDRAASRPWSSSRATCSVRSRLSAGHRPRSFRRSSMDRGQYAYVTSLSPDDSGCTDVPIRLLPSKWIHSPSTHGS